MPKELNGIDIIRAIKKDDFPDYIQGNLPEHCTSDDAVKIILALDAAVFNRTILDIQTREEVRKRFINEIEYQYRNDVEEEEFEKIAKMKMKSLKK